MASPPTTLERVKAVAQDDANIQALTTGDVVWQVILEDVQRECVEDVFGDDTEQAQRYLAAHRLATAYQPNGGRGPVSSVSVGGISQSFTLPYLNRKDDLGSTQYGMKFIQIRDRNIAAFRMVVPEDIAGA